MRFKSLAIILTLIVTIPSITIGCCTIKREVTLTDFAQHWINENAGHISETIAGEIGSGVPVSTSTFASIIKKQISGHVPWTYSQPIKLSDNAYRVIARTTLSYDIPQSGGGNIDVGIDLTINTEQEEVTAAEYTIHSYSYTPY